MLVDSRKNRAMKKPPTPKSTQHNYVQTALRLPPELHVELQDAAERNGRSMNAEIVARLVATPINDQLARLIQDVAEIKALDRQIFHIMTYQKPQSWHPKPDARVSGFFFACRTWVVTC